MRPSHLTALYAARQAAAEHGAAAAAAAEEHRQERAAAAEQLRQQRAAAAEQRRQDRAAAVEQRTLDRAAAAERHRQDRAAAAEQRRQDRASLHNLGRQQLDHFEEKIFQHSKLKKLTDPRTHCLSIGLLRHISEVYGDLTHRHQDKQYMSERTILTLKNRNVDSIDDMIMQSFPGEVAF